MKASSFQLAILVFLCFNFLQLFSQEPFKNRVPDPPPAPVLQWPPNGAFSEPAVLQMTWNKSQNAVTYKLQVSLDTLFNSCVVNDSTLNDSTTIVTLQTWHNYFWRVNAKNASGTSPYSEVWSFGTNPLGLNQLSTDIPAKFSLYYNYPNPFNPTTKIQFAIRPPLTPPEGEKYDQSVKLVIYDILGREITTLVDEQLNPGTYEVDWNGSNYPSGVYYYSLKTGSFSETKTAILLK